VFGCATVLVLRPDDLLAIRRRPRITRWILDDVIILPVSCRGLDFGRMAVGPRAMRCALVALATLLAYLAQPAYAQGTDRKETELNYRILNIGKLPQAEQAAETQRLALEVQKLAPGAQKEIFAVNLVWFSNADDPRTLQVETTTLAESLRGRPKTENLVSYKVLAELVRYDHTHASLDSPQMAAAIAELDARDRTRQQADFTLRDLSGKAWTLKSLSGKVVLVNFWSPGCGGCLDEMPALGAIYQRFAKQGLVILAISTNTETGNTRAFLAKHPLPFPVLPDPDGKVSGMFQVTGIPVTVLYNRSGKLAWQTFGSRTEEGFLTVLSDVGLR